MCTLLRSQWDVLSALVNWCAEVLYSPQLRGPVATHCFSLNEKEKAGGRAENDVMRTDYWSLVGRYCFPISPIAQLIFVLWIEWVGIRCLVVVAVSWRTVICGLGGWTEREWETFRPSCCEIPFQESFVGWAAKCLRHMSSIVWGHVSSSDATSSILKVWIRGFSHWNLFRW